MLGHVFCDFDYASQQHNPSRLTVFLYVLDYGSERMVSIYPTNNFEQIGTFGLNTNITTANEQFAIGCNGNFSFRLILQLNPDSLPFLPDALP